MERYKIILLVLMGISFGIAIWLFTWLAWYLSTASHYTISMNPGVKILSVLPLTFAIIGAVPAIILIVQWVRHK